MTVLRSARALLIGLAVALAAPAVAQQAHLPDLVATRAWLAKYVPPAQLTRYEPVTGPLEYGARVYLVCDLGNEGQRPVKGKWQVGYFVDGQRVYTQTFGLVPPHRKQSPAAWYVAAKDGAHTYECRVDVTNAVREVSERNNAARTSFAVKPWSADLAVTLRPQETGMWCWAAGTQMAMQFLGVNVEQCEQANFRFNRTDCCTIQRCPTPVGGHGCVQGGWPNLDHWGFTSLETGWGTALTFQQLTTEFTAGRPVLFSWGWVGGGGHLMAARGVTRIQGVEYVHINDPWAPCTGNVRLVTYQEFVERAGSHVHWRDYYAIRRAPAGDVRPAVFAFVEDGQGGLLGTVEPASAAAPGAARGLEELAPLPRSTAGQAPLLASAKAAAAATLRALQTEVSAARGLGLEPVAGAAEGEAEPIRELFVRLDELEAYAAGGDPARLLHDSGALLVPVVAGTQVRTGVTVAKAPGGYRTVAIGDQTLTQAAVAQLPEARGPGAAAPERLMVRIPALKLYFIGRREGGRLTLVPLADEPRFDLKAGTPVDAAALFERLVPAAREVVPDVPS